MVRRCGITRGEIPVPRHGKYYSGYKCTTAHHHRRVANIFPIESEISIAGKNLFRYRFTVMI
jgi:hypothetical protein